jgi:hypothetical protein
MNKYSDFKSKTKLLLSLLETGKSIKECLQIIGFSYHYHTKYKNQNSVYREEFEESVKIGKDFVKYNFLKKLKSNKSNLNKTLRDFSISNATVYNWKKNDSVFELQFNLLLKELKVVKLNNHRRGRDVEVPVIYSKYEEQNNGRRLYEKLPNGELELVYKYCSGCNKHLYVSNFHKNTNSKDGIVNRCIDCSTKKRLNHSPRRRGEYYKGEKIKKFNSLGSVTERRCTQCKEFKPIKKFNYLYRSTSVCETCFKILPNSKNLKPKGQFYKGVQIRYFDKNMYVIRKKCSECNIVRPINSFSKNNSNKLDGRVGKCKICSNNKPKIKIP